MRSKSGLSRADLLWSFASVDSSQHQQIAEILGFEKHEESRQETVCNDQSQVNQQNPEEIDSDSVEPPTDEESFKPVSTSSSYYRITSRSIDQTENQTETTELNLPAWFTEASPTLLEETKTRIPSVHQVKPLHTELTAWSRLLPFLQKILGSRVEGRRPDTVRLVKQAAQHEMIRKIPRKQRFYWATKARMLIDINDDNFPYRRDFLHLRDRLLQARGNEGLDVQYVYDEPGSYVVRYQQQREFIEPWSSPEQGTPILILSDLGMHSQSRQTLYGWLAFGQMLNAQGFRATVLMPVAERHIDNRLLRFFDCIVWDRTGRLKLIKGDYQAEKDKYNHPESIDQLLSYFFAVVRADSGLLRTVRHLLPGAYDIGHEIAIWRHAAVVSEGDEWGWQAGSKSNYLEQAQRLIAEISPEQKLKLVELIGRYHALYPDELYFEAMYSLKLLGLELPVEVEKATEQFMQDMVKTYQANLDNSLLHAWVKRHLVRYEVKAIRQEHRYWCAFMAFAKKRDEQKTGATTSEWPDDLSDVEKEEAWLFLNATQTVRTYQLRQVGEKLALIPEKIEIPQPDTFQTAMQDDWSANAQSGTTLLTLNLTDTHIFHTHTDQRGEQHIVSLNLGQAHDQTFQLPATGQHTFQIGWERITVDVKSAQQQKEDWMVFMGSGSEGIYAESKDQQNHIYRWYWDTPVFFSGARFSPGFWGYAPEYSSRLMPDWAGGAGRDEYGLYADVIVKDILLRFRWIEPASFVMGSPKDEEGHYEREILHQVILTQGYWLAETACTQELWQAVMRENPSDFKGTMKPVENVSWNEIQNFLEQLNKQHPELNLRLPTEAEWENACRAGTTGAFNFDGELSLDKVNYRGTWEYESDKWGEGALKETADVKSYPPNAWGLYEMHGNVWEWCLDRYGDYAAEPVIDPKGAESGDSRVLRGGSWFFGGRDCRSAYRFLDDPSLRRDLTGFRLVRGHELKSVRSVRAGQQPDGSHAGGARGGQMGDGLRGGEEQKGMLDWFKDFMK